MNNPSAHVQLNLVSPGSMTWGYGDKHDRLQRFPTDT